MLAALILVFAPKLLPARRVLPIDAPSGASCTATAGSVAADWQLVEGSDLYDVAYADLSRPHSNPFGWVTSTSPRVNITGLDSSTAYWIKVRAHVDGIGGYGNDMLWSSFSAAVNCSAGQSPKPLAPPSDPEAITGAPQTRFQRIYRITETLGLAGAYRPPDYLRDHNSADSLGSASFLTWAVLQGLMSTTESVNISTITEYCVEMVDQPWAAYMSCVPGGNYTWANVPRFQAVDNEPLPPRVASCKASAARRLGFTVQLFCRRDGIWAA